MYRLPSVLRMSAARQLAVRNYAKDAALRPFSGKSGLLAELLNIVFSPSSSNDKVSHHTDNEYFHAEKQGKQGAPCAEIFKNCPVSILDIFTAIPGSFNEIMKKN
uniref:Uncharacterized protein n=1 Tax=Phlebotomus papatasi TaxID=29031 RepID=A0A1B0D6N4_PHLPP